MLTTHLDRSEQEGWAGDEAPAEEAGPDTIPEQHLVKMIQVGMSCISDQHESLQAASGKHEGTRKCPMLRICCLGAK